jgi:hypothetical protein
VTNVGLSTGLFVRGLANAVAWIGLDSGRDLHRDARGDTTARKSRATAITITPKTVASELKQPNAQRENSWIATA